jgi:hypothetical protein
VARLSGTAEACSASPCCSRMFVSHGDASVLLRIGAIRNYVGAACQCVDGFEAVDSEKGKPTCPPPSAAH